MAKNGCCFRERTIYRRLENFELAKLIGLGLQDKEVIKICERNNWLGGK